MTQAHREKEISKALIVEVVSGSQQPVTRTQIARALQRSKSPHMNRLIDEMVAEGVLHRQVTTFPNGVRGYVYALAGIP